MLMTTNPTTTWQRQVPKYVYECKECGFIKESVHSMQEKLKDCEECDTLDSLMRIPSFSFLRSGAISNMATGDKVKEFIDDSREELRSERRDLMKKRQSND